MTDLHCWKIDSCSSIEASSLLQFHDDRGPLHMIMLLNAATVIGSFAVPKMGT